MSNTYQDTTGVLTFRGSVQATPIIKALFGAFELDTNYPGGNQAYIAKIAESSSTSWDAVVEEITRNAEGLGIELPELTDEQSAIEELLGLLATKFDCTGAVDEILDELDGDDDADIQDLFRLALLFDDGHGLLSVSTETGWHGDKPRLFDFGGAGQHFSKHLSAFNNSSAPINVGAQVDAAIAEGRVDEAGALLANQAYQVLDWATDSELAEEASAALARKLATPETTPLDLEGRTFQLFVGIGAGSDDGNAPRWLQLALDQALVDSVGRQQQLLKLHKLTHLESWSNPAWETTVSMTCEMLVVGADGFWWSAYPKHGEQAVETVHVDFAALAAAVNDAVIARRESVRFGINDDDTWQDCLEALQQTRGES